MSHIPERKEKNCLNCGTIVQGHYCQHCGQENVEPKETFWHMVTHFFYDLTHFDSSFFYTIHHLILKPGFLSKEYVKGRRASYLHPIRMYVFVSAIFFLLFFSLFKPAHSITRDSKGPFDAKQRAAYTERLEQQLKKDTGNARLRATLALVKDTARPFTSSDSLTAENGKGIRTNFTNRKEYKNFEEYDSAEKTLPPARRDGWFLRWMIKRSISIKNKYEENPNEAIDKLVENILHRLPYMLFVSLPLFALILRLVYIRRKQFYFADHGVFTIHLYVFTFLILLAVFSLNSLQDVVHWKFIGWLIAILFLTLFFYLYKAMRNFYGQRRGKTFLKFLLVSFLSLIMMLILFLVFLFFSAFTL